jgi:predicted RNase H-like HicB family nuclease
MEASPQAHRYRVSLHRARGTWFASVLDIPGCVGRGATEVEALESARGVIRTYMQIARMLSLDPARIVLEISA